MYNYYKKENENNLKCVTCSKPLNPLVRADYPWPWERLDLIIRDPL